MVQNKTISNHKWLIREKNIDIKNKTLYGLSFFIWIVDPKPKNKIFKQIALKRLNENKSNGGRCSMLPSDEIRNLTLKEYLELSSALKQVKMTYNKRKDILDYNNNIEF